MAWQVDPRTGLRSGQSISFAGEAWQAILMRCPSQAGTGFVEPKWGTLATSWELLCDRVVSLLCSITGSHKSLAVSYMISHVDVSTRESCILQKASCHLGPANASEAVLTGSAQGPDHETLQAAQGGSCAVPTHYVDEVNRGTNNLQNEGIWRYLLTPKTRDIPATYSHWRRGSMAVPTHSMTRVNHVSQLHHCPSSKFFGQWCTLTHAASSTYPSFRSALVKNVHKLKRQCHDIQRFFGFFARAKNRDCSRKCRRHQTWKLRLPRGLAASPPTLATDSARERTTSRARLHRLTCRQRQAALLFSSYEARAGWQPLLQGSRLAATAISITVFFFKRAPSEDCFGDHVAESMGDWKKEPTVWS